MSDVQAPQIFLWPVSTLRCASVAKTRRLVRMMEHFSKFLQADPWGDNDGVRQIRCLDTSGIINGSCSSVFGPL